MTTAEAARREELEPLLVSISEHFGVRLQRVVRARVVEVLEDFLRSGWSIEALGDQLERDRANSPVLLALKKAVSIGET